MKKSLFIILAIIAVSFSTNAQQRLVLYEEFTSDNNASCAAINPSFWGLCDTLSNQSKMIQIAYAASIPASSDSFYYQDSSVTNDRLNYYATSLAYTYVGGAFAPSGFRDGLTTDLDSALPGQPRYFSQYDIDSEYAAPASFNMTVSNSWNATYDSVYTSITVFCVNAFNDPGSNLKLRIALVENIDWATPPGSDGETHFQHVVRSMYPNANGTPISCVWTLGESVTYNFTCPVAAYVNKAKSPFMVAWIQNDSSKYVEQSAVATPLPGLLNDAVAISTSAPGFVCLPNGIYRAAHSMVLQNGGTDTLTSAKIYYSIDGSAVTSYLWTGSLAASASTTVTLPPVSYSVTGTSSHYFKDSVAMPNDSVAYSTNNVSQSSFFIESTVPFSLPFATGFETGRNQFYSYNITANDSEKWQIYTSGTSTSFAHSGNYAASYHCFNFATSDQAVLTMPEVANSSPSAIDFWVAYAEYGSSTGIYGDTLQIVYSIDCGTTWIPVWTEFGSTLATVPPDSNFYVPRVSSDYVHKSANINTVPPGAMIGFRGNSGWGNNIWLDDINIHAGFVLGTQQITSENIALNIYPDPAQNESNLSFYLSNSSYIRITIVDELGRIVNNVVNENMTMGSHQVTLNIRNLDNGIYNILLQSEQGIFTKRLSVVK